MLTALWSETELNRLQTENEFSRDQTAIDEFEQLRQSLKDAQIETEQQWKQVKTDAVVQALEREQERIESELSLVLLERMKTLQRRDQHERMLTEVERQRAKLEEHGKWRTQDPPDLTILFDYVPTGDKKGYYRFRLLSFIRNLNLWFDEFRTPETSVTPRGFLDETYLHINKMMSDRAMSDVQFFERLNSIGASLYERLFPEELKYLYWDKLREMVKSIVIISYEPWIPWELVNPFHPVSKQTEDGFLCEKYNLTRWLAGCHAPDLISLTRLGLVVTRDIQSGGLEANELKQLFGQNVEAVSPTAESVYQILKTGGFSALHFACHGTFNRNNPDWSTLLLEEGATLSPIDINGEKLLFSRDKPFIFLNACETARGEYALTGLGGWADAFVRRAKCSGFVGSIWEATDETAYKFAIAFYRNLLDGKAVGESARLARLTIKKAKDPTWLSYTVYANPLARIYVEATDRSLQEDRLETPSNILIVDASESAISSWSQTAKTVADLIATLPADTIDDVHLLGTSLHWEANEWKSDMPAPLVARNSGSFIAPVMDALHTARVNPQSIIIVGTGEVYDLMDWVGTGARYVLVRVGNESLQDASNRLPEVTSDSLSTLIDELRTTPVAQPKPVRKPHPHSNVISHAWQIDRAGYPMVRVEPLNAFMNLFPVTKPQFEQFLANARLPDHGDTWYTNLLKLNPRLSPMADSFVDYEKIFVTGLLPEDAQSYFLWHSGNVRPLTVEEWRVAFQWLEQQDISALPVNLEVRLASTARHLWDGLIDELKPRTLLDLSLMQGGVVEWVTDMKGKWVGLGKPRAKFYRNLHDPMHDLFMPTSWTRRGRIWGMRLIQPC